MNDAIFRNKTCPYCDTPITPNEAIRPGHCSDRECATRHAVKGQHDVRRGRRDGFARSLISARRDPRFDETVRAAGGKMRGDVHLVTVPYQNKPLVPVPEARMARFRAHLREVIETAFEGDAESHPVMMVETHAEPETPLASAGCATCQGACCRLGNKANAFLQVETMKAHRRNWPELTPDIIFNNYIAALPELAVEDACVFQGAEGCTLHRQMRSNVCNKFHCHELEFAREKLENAKDKPVVLAGCDDEGTAQKFAVLERLSPDPED